MTQTGLSVVRFDRYGFRSGRDETPVQIVVGLPDSDGTLHWTVERTAPKPAEPGLGGPPPGPVLDGAHVVVKSFRPSEVRPSPIDVASIRLQFAALRRLPDPPPALYPYRAREVYRIDVSWRSAGGDRVAAVSLPATVWDCDLIGLCYEAIELKYAGPHGDGTDLGTKSFRRYTGELGKAGAEALCASYLLCAQQVPVPAALRDQRWFFFDPGGTAGVSALLAETTYLVLVEGSVPDDERWRAFLDLEDIDLLEPFLLIHYRHLNHLALTFSRAHTAAGVERAVIEFSWAQLAGEEAEHVAHDLAKVVWLLADANTGNLEKLWAREPGLVQVLVRSHTAKKANPKLIFEANLRDAMLEGTRGAREINTHLSRLWSHEAAGWH